MNQLIDTLQYIRRQPTPPGSPYRDACADPDTVVQDPDLFLGSGHWVSQRRWQGASTRCLSRRSDQPASQPCCACNGDLVITRVTECPGYTSRRMITR